MGKMKKICLMFVLSMVMAALPGMVMAEEKANNEITASDYTDESNWLMIPEITKEIDTFYIYPTAYFDTSEGAPDVCGIDSEMLREGAADCYAQQGTAYEAATNVFAPYYRQVNMTVASTASAEERDALLQKEPKADLFAALDYYFENLNEGRPYFLAAHSQGSQMMTYVLSEYMKEHPDYYDRMVAAYALGYSITDEFLKENPHLKFAEGPDDTGVIISWNTEGEGNENEQNFVVEEGAIAINPLNWKRDETYAGKAECLGAYVLNEETGEYELIPEAADAQLNTKRGVVVTHTDVIAPMDESMGFGPDSYHGGDYSLWYSNIQENVLTRKLAWDEKDEGQASSPAHEAKALRDQGEDEAAVAILEEAVVQGDPEVQFALGNCYYDGAGVEQNYEEAVKYYKLAADQGMAWAQTNLGQCSLLGLGVEQDNEEAMRLFRLAANQGDEVAIFNIGYCYYFGEGVQVDYEEALKYYYLSAEKDLPVAFFAIGDCYYLGNGVEKDLEEAKKWYRKALAADYEPDETDKEHLKEVLGEDQ